MIKIATLVGCAIGDALGNPFEMKPAASPSIKEWDGQFKAGGTFWKGEPGQYTDDTLMSMALAASIIDKGGYDPSDAALKYLAWYNSGNTRGIGGTTAGAMVNLKMGATWQESGLKAFGGKPPCGNGTAMRASPLGLWCRHDLELLVRSAMDDASITHNALEPKMGSVAVALGTALLANGTRNNLQALDEVIDILAPSEVLTKLQLARLHLENRTTPSIALAEIGSSGYVPETVGAAFYCLGAAASYQETVIMAIRAGGDTDTTAAIAGAMAGTFYGLDAIPAEYKDKVENFELLQLLTDQLTNNQI